ncbi:MAG TPA: efflux RND transporter permease subunit [Phycisphaerales bacterium]|nr:efflux RND transporter permease subunit [Phycisphaerales bacterium]
MKSFTDIFIKKPVLAIVINLIILAVGFQAISHLPVRQYPRLESSAVTIQTFYIGASAETVRGFITTPIEKAVSAIDGIDYIESSSTAGVSMITVRLRLNHDSNDALAEISARLNQVRSELPQEAESPVIEIVRTDKPYATFYIAMQTDTLTLPQLNDYMARELQPELQSLPGVQKAGIEGPRALAMRIWLDSRKLEAFDVTPFEVQSALVRNNFVATVGRTKGAEVQIDLVTDTDLRSPEEFRQLIVRQVQGTIVRLGDVARVELGSEEPMGQAGFNGKPAIWFSIWPLPSANELDVAKALKAKLAELQPTLPSGVEMTLAYDGTYYMENAIREIRTTLMETIGIVALVVFIFMGSFRTVLVPLVAMPVSLVGACLAILLMGFSLNLLTILAIVLAVGLVVDDAIVVVENVERHVQEGKTRLQAALIGARELMGPVVAMTITLAAVYAPIGFQGGLTGMLFREFAFTLASAVIISGVVAITLSPIMSAKMVPAGGKESRFQRFVNRRFETIRRVYARQLDFVLQMRWAVAVCALLITAAAVPLYLKSRSELAPTEDEGVIFTFVQAAPDSSLENTIKSFNQVGDIFLNVPERKFYFQVAMVNSGFGGIQTQDWGKRDRTTAQIKDGDPAKHGMDGLYAQLSMVPGVMAFPQTPPPLPGAGQFDVELVITSTDEAEDMAPLAGQLVGAAFQSGKFQYADTDLKLDLPQTKIVIDREKVADLGLDLASVGRDLAVMLSGGYTNRFNYEGRSYKVIPQVEDLDRSTPEKILDLKVRSANGGLASVRSFLELETKAGPRALTRFQQRNSFKVFGGAAPGVTKAEALTALEDAARKVLPAGYTIDYAGESRQIRKESSSLVTTLGLALGLIYLVLAAQFSSFRDPLIVLLGSVPLAITGALLFTYLGFTTLNIYSQVGLITLVGLVAKNGILIVEFANHLQEQGLSKFEAVKQASATRLRPILMTSAATVFGHFPLVLVTGAGAEARNSIGITLVAGMTISTLFTLFVVPCIYMLIAAQHKHAELDADGLPIERLPARAPVLNGVHQREVVMS